MKKTNDKQQKLYSHQQL